MSSVSDVLLLAAAGILGVAMVLALLSMLREATTLTRLVAIEVVVNTLIGIIALWAMHLKLLFVLDIAIVLALIMFLSTVAYCQYLMGREPE